METNGQIQTPQGSNNAGNVIGWLEKLLNLKKDYGLGNMLSTMLLLFVAIIMGVIAFNPGVIVKEIQRVQNEQHRVAVEKRLKVDPEIRTYVTDLRTELNADRTFVLEAHNGGSNLTALPFLYVDMTYESVRGNEHLLQDEYKNVRLQRYEFATFVYNNNFWCGSVDDVGKLDQVFYYRIMGDEVKYIAVLALYGKYNLVGALGVEYTVSEPEAANTIRQVMYKYGSKMAILLSNEEQIEKK